MSESQIITSNSSSYVKLKTPNKKFIDNNKRKDFLVNFTVFKAKGVSFDKQSDRKGLPLTSFSKEVSYIEPSKFKTKGALSFRKNPGRDDFEDWRDKAPAVGTYRYKVNPIICKESQLCCLVKS